MAEQLKKKDSKIEALKTAPHSIDAEQSVLGGLILDNHAWDNVSERVIHDDFYLNAHRIIFKAIEKLAEQNQPIDLVTLSERLESVDELEQAGGFAYLLEIQKNTPSAANILAYADIVRERAVLREMIAVANEIAESGYDTSGQDSRELLEAAETKVFAIAEKRAKKNEGPKLVHSILSETLKRIEELAAQEDNTGITGLSTGFYKLDEMTAGLQNSDLIIVAARPSMGKTTFAMNLVEHAAMNAEHPALVFSLEMPSEQIMMRMLASLSRVDQTKIRTGKLEDEDWNRIASAVQMMKSRGKLLIDDASGLSPSEVRSRARRVHKEHGGVSMIMVDYLQLMSVPGMSENRTLEIAEISRSLKALAKELNCPVIALSQLNRSLEQRSDKRPVNSDLRESGSIEQDADVIMFIYRDEVYNPDATEDKGLAEIIIGKQRNGPIGRLKLKFHGSLSRFDNYTNAEIEDLY
ncbi:MULTISPECIES: replicative DNA helicase [Gammaproteobacteria]|uniref:replicative DNA helicase n=1 Tax=Gammaproteobacteria TaxID=1236 RepID=UPI000DCFB43D|nr:MULTISPECIES: replicative DNA helicase [Gammaproteobacteria]RTE87664.1 replicative DNA helicase [Aliidiomarina sp. B3213]TCZ92552.1 replicative DNA helicase [Lysobacter sp. N42]